MMKTLWLTSMASSEDLVKKFMSQMKTYGLDVKGHFWEDDLEKVAWSRAREALVDPKIALWAVMASSEDLAAPAIRYGVSLLTITLQAKKGLGFPIVIVQTQGEALSPETLPTPLKGVDVLPAAASTLGAKLVAKAHTPAKEVSSEYRLDIYGNAQIGQWFEVGPLDTSWPGAMFGVAGAEIGFHAVGPKGKLPSKAVLNYPLQGLKLQHGDKDYTAWAVQNELDPELSYFVKVEGFAESIVFGSYSTQEQADVYVVGLK